MKTYDAINLNDSYETVAKVKAPLDLTAVTLHLQVQGRLLTC